MDDGRNLKAEGYAVFVEDQNKFTLKGRAATLGGVPDLVAVRGAEALVVDCKSGKQRGCLLYTSQSPRD